MRDTKTLRWLRWAVLAGLAMSLLTACTVSVSGGILGALASMGVFALVALLVGGAQTGCVEDAPAPDDAEVDAVVGPCLTDAHIGPCLGAPLDDAGRIEPDFGPCLSPDQGFLEEDAAVIGPCLGAPLPDLGPDEGQPDMRIDDAGLPDLEVGPCLEPPPEPDQPPGKATAPGVIDRAAIFAKVTAGLPADVAARLVRRDDEV